MQKLKELSVADEQLSRNRTMLIAGGVAALAIIALIAFYVGKRNAMEAVQSPTVRTAGPVHPRVTRLV